jgi:drug/metabolite transporter (DMT)-like permease
MKMSRRIPVTQGWGVVLAVMTALVSGVSIYVNAFGVKQVPDAAVYTTLKNGVAAAVLLAVLLAGREATDVRRLRPRQWGGLALLGLIGGSTPFVLFFTGLAQASAPSAAFIHKTLFVWVALLAAPLLGERLGAWQLVGLGLLFTAQLLVTPPTGVHWGTGETLIAIATAMWAVEVIVAKRVLAGIGSGVAAVGRMAFGLVILATYLALAGKLGGVTVLAPQAWAWVVITGLLLAAYVATWYAALQRAPATVVTSVLVAGAVVTAVLQTAASGAFPRPEVLGGYLLIAAAVAGIAVLTSRTARARPAEVAVTR